MVDLVAVHDQALDGLLKGDHGEGGGEDGGQDIGVSAKIRYFFWTPSLQCTV